MLYEKGEQQLFGLEEEGRSTMQMYEEVEIIAPPSVKARIYRNQQDIKTTDGQIITDDVHIMPPPEFFPRSDWIIAEQNEIAGLLALDVMELVHISEVPKHEKIASTRFVHTVKSGKDVNVKTQPVRSKLN